MRVLLFATIAAGLLASRSAESNPKTFLTEAIEGDNSEIQLGAAAAQRGGPAVQSFGRMLVGDHSKARQAAVVVAAGYGLNPTDKLSDEAAKERDKLEKLEGSAFDAEFAQYMIKDHQQNIAKFEKEAQSSAPANVRTLATQTLPELRKHLALAEQLR